tara:strand:- start:13657 stop:13920 length:264 start_codon:yes stop_codon:yes gene_type:complete
MGLTNKKNALVKRHLARARTINHHAQNYGGSTGGRKSIDRGSGLSVLNRRSAEQAADNQVFKEDLDQYGARREAWEAKKDIYPSLGT